MFFISFSKQIRCTAYCLYHCSCGFYSSNRNTFRKHSLHFKHLQMKEQNTNKTPPSTPAESTQNPTLSLPYHCTHLRYDYLPLLLSQYTPRRSHQTRTYHARGWSLVQLPSHMGILNSGWHAMLMAHRTSHRNNNVPWNDGHCFVDIKGISFSFKYINLI